MDRNENTPPLSRRGAVATGARTLAAAAVAGHALGAGPAGAQHAPPGRFAGQVVLVTGATSGIGRRTAERFAQEGARVFFCGRREALGREVEAGIRRAGGDATYMRADVRQEADVRALVEGCVAKYGRIDVAFNNAGIGAPRIAPIGEQPQADFDDVMSTNARGVFTSLKYELPRMAANPPRGAFGTRGVVINTASTSGLAGFPGISPYSASKHAVIGITRCAALEYSPQGVRVVSISPGGVETPMRNAAYAGRVAPGQPDPPAPNLFRRTNTTDEMAEVVMFLASDAASSITGMDVDVTGGYHAGASLTQAPRG